MDENFANELASKTLGELTEKVEWNEELQVYVCAYLLDRRNWHLTAAGGDEGVTFQAKTRLPPQRIDPVRDRLLELNRHGCLRMHGDQVIVADVVVNDVEDALVLTATCGAAGGEVSEQEALRVANLLIEAMRVSHGFLA